MEYSNKYYYHFDLLNSDRYNVDPMKDHINNFLWEVSNDEGWALNCREGLVNDYETGRPDDIYELAMMYGLYL